MENTVFVPGTFLRVSTVDAERLDALLVGQECEVFDLDERLVYRVLRVTAREDMPRYRQPDDCACCMPTEFEVLFEAWSCA